MGKALVASISAAVGDEFTSLTSGLRFVWHARGKNIRILECHVTREPDRWVIKARGGVVASQHWDGMSAVAPLLVPNRIDRVDQMPVEVHGTYQELGTHVVPRGARGPDLESAAFINLVEAIAGWARAF